MRLFTGIDVPYQMRRNLELLLELLRPAASIAWSPLGNLHVTTKFIGEWPEDRLAELRAALSGVPRPGPLRLGLKGLGWFPNPHAPRVFFAAIEHPPELAQLAAATERACAALGVPEERRAFSPHLTLARIKSPAPLIELKRAIAGLPSADFGGWEAGEFHLYQSQLRPGGSVYTKLASFSLAS
jgi:2'-5' RNA ligase